METSHTITVVNIDPFFLIPKIYNVRALLTPKFWLCNRIHVHFRTLLLSLFFFLQKYQRRILRPSVWLRKSEYILLETTRCHPVNVSIMFSSQFHIIKKCFIEYEKRIENSTVFINKTPYAGIVRFRKHEWARTTMTQCKINTYER